MPATLIDGRAQAAALRGQLTRLAGKLRQRPRLATILVGDDPASQIYVTNKLKVCAEIGIAAQLERLSATISAASLKAVIAQLNSDPTVHGILLQLPLPAHLDTAEILSSIDPRKDVDGLHPLNAGLLAQGRTSGFIPCTPRGCLQLIRSVCPSLYARPALIIGRSLLVGRPMAQLLVQQDCTVTLAHSKSRDVPLLAVQAEILVVAAGQPGLVQRDWVKPGAIVIDVGINRTATGLCGDVAPDVADVAGYLTPVPGGVGPMTIANLMANVMLAACRQSGDPIPTELQV